MQEGLLAQTVSRADAQSITRSAGAMIEGGTVMPSLRATRRLTFSSNVVGCCIGKSVGRAPRRILSM